MYGVRRLEGVGKNPTLRVALKCASKVKKTKSKRGSITPEFNEVIKNFKIFTDPLGRPRTILFISS